MNSNKRALSTNIRAREQRVRRKLKSEGLILRKSRVLHTHVDNYGGYMIINAYTNGIEAGLRYDMFLDDIERYAFEEEDPRETTPPEESEPNG